MSVATDDSFTGDTVTDHRSTFTFRFNDVLDVGRRLVTRSVGAALGTAGSPETRKPGSVGETR